MDNDSAQTGDDDEARLQELWNLQILDTPEEEHFDKYTQLIADVLNTPMASISLVAENRVWFKSQVGLSTKEVESVQAPSIEALSQDYFEVPDTRNDERFAYHSIVTGAPFLRFYAGAVLHGPTGKPVGTLAVMDRHPRELSDRSQAQLVTFASLVEKELLLHDRIKTRVYDPATGLPARELMTANLSQSLEHDQSLGQMTAVLHIKLFNYDRLTALLGHESIERVVHNVIQCVRDNVDTHHAVGRLSINHIGVVFGGLKDAESDRQWLYSLASHLAGSVQVGAYSRIVQLTAGIACAPPDATTADDLLDCAQIASADAASTHEQVSFYSASMRAQVARRHDMINRLHDALGTGGLTQVYQPIVATSDGRLVAVEALARWYDSVYGQVAPGEFIPLCEQDPALRHVLTTWSLETACEQISRWLQTEDPCPQISVNIPGAELYRDDFASGVRDMLAHYAIPADCVLLEVTEQSLITDIDSAVAAMKALRREGIQFAVDDFGTGYSSLSYLQKLPLDALKIDRSFIAEIDTCHVTHELTRNIVAIAEALDLRVIAEGIETPAQHHATQQLQCHYEQGFWFGYPQSAEAIEAEFLDKTALNSR